MPTENGKNKVPRMTVRRELEFKLVAMSLAVVVRVGTLLGLMELPKDLEQTITFAALNSGRMALMILDPENADEYTLKSNSITPRISCTPEGLRSQTASLIWRAFLVGRMVNRMRIEEGLPSVDWYKEVLELDKESNENTL